MKKTAFLLIGISIFAFGCKSDEPTDTSTTPPATTATTTQPTTTAANASGFGAVAPIFAKNCVGCHGEKGKAGIDLRTQASILKGGMEGPIVAAGDPAGSKLVTAIHGGDAHVKKMPPKPVGLTPDEIAKIEAWIKDGAKA